MPNPSMISDWQHRPHREQQQQQQQLMQRMRLHAWNVSKANPEAPCPCPSANDGLKSESPEERFRTLGDIATKALQTHIGDSRKEADGSPEWEGQWSVWKEGSHAQLVGSLKSTNSCWKLASVFRVPLAFAELCHAASEGYSVIAVCPWKPSSLASERCVWLVVVEGSKAEFRTAVQALASGGAVIADVQGELLLPKDMITCGSSGVVFNAQCKHSVATECRQVVVKGMLANSESSEKRLRTEVLKLVAVQGHPNVARFVGVFQCAHRKWAPSAGGLLLATEKYNKGNLNYDVLDSGVYGERGARRLLRGLLSALMHVHSRGVIHRNVKPENVFLSEDNRAVLGDFGLSTLISDSKELRRQCGTPGFMAPEVVTGLAYDAKVDLFSLGVALWFAISGEEPDVPNIKEQDVQVRELRNIEHALTYKSALDPAQTKPLSEDLRQGILKLLCVEPASRPSARDAFEMFFAATKGNDVEPRPSRPSLASKLSKAWMQLKRMDQYS